MTHHARPVLSMLTLVALISGCSGRTAYPTAPGTTPEPGPELRAEWGFLFRPDIPIGPAPAGPQVVPAAAGAAASEPALTVRGAGELPGLRLSCVGAFRSVRIDFHVDGALWWSPRVDLGADDGRRHWLSVYGMPWTPADTGLHVIRMVIDPANEHAELDETDNEATFTVRTVDGDLGAALLHFVAGEGAAAHEVTSVPAGTPVRIAISTFAYGPFTGVREVVDAGGAVLLDRRFDIAGGSVFPASANDTVTFVPTAAGTVVVRHAVDPDLEQRDRARVNNVSTRPLVVTP